VCRLSDFFPDSGGDTFGRCVVCGRETKGFKASFPETFTAYPLLEGGSIVCGRCWSMLKNGDLRRRSWLACIEGNKPAVRFLSRQEALQVLLEPPQPPFAVYLTKTGKKQGFLLLANRVSTSRDLFYVALDDQLLLVDRKKLQRYVELARRAVEAGLRKGDLSEGCGVKAWEHEDLCREVEAVRGDPLWGLAVWLI